MSKVKIEGNASGSGTLTISAPNTNTDRSLTLPDAAGEVLVTDGTITIDDTNDRVGIGTSSPDNKLHIFNADSGGSSFTDTYLTIENSGNTRLQMLSGTSSSCEILMGDSGSNRQGRIQYDNSSDALILQTTNAERMRLDSNGNLLVGTNSQVSGETISILKPGANSAAILSKPSSNTAYYAYVIRNYSNATVGSIYTNGSTTAFNTSSDYRLKENVVDMTGAIDRVKALQPKRFNFIADADTTVDGFLAHEVSDVIPEAISGEKDATREEEYEVTPAVLDDDGNVVTEAVMGTRTVPDYQGIDQSKLVPLLTGALQEAIAKIEALETTVADLTTRIEALENA